MPRPLTTHTDLVALLQDTLLVTGYSMEEAEEVVAMVMSVLDSPMHFKEQAVNVLEEVRKNSFHIILL